MNRRLLISVCLLAASLRLAAQTADTTDAAAPEARREVRYALALINDATVYGGLQQPLPEVLNQVLVEPTLTLRYKPQWSFSTSLVGMADTYADTFTQGRVKEAYAGLSAGDFDFLAGRRIVRWGTGYAFTAAGVLDPPRVATNPTDRLNLNEGRDMVKADFVRGPHAFTAAWATAALAPASATVHDTAAFRYNVLLHGFDTALIAGKDRGGDAFGALTLTRVLGEAWEVHGEAMWREHQAALIGAKYTTRTGVTFLAEFFSPPNIPYYRDMTIAPTAGRQNYIFFNAGKSRLRERPGWKQWDLSGSVVSNLNDRSYTAIFDATRRFGNFFSAYTHMEFPGGSKNSEYGATPYKSALSLGVRFQL